MKKLHNGLTGFLAATLVLCQLFSCVESTQNQTDIYQEFNGHQRAHLRIQLNDSSVILSRRPLGVKVQNTPEGVVIYSRAKKVCYTVEGHSGNSCIRINSDYPFMLQMKGLHLSNKTGPAIDIRSSQTAAIIVSGENELSDARMYGKMAETVGLKGCISSQGNLLFCGDGKLQLQGNYKHAVKAEGFIRVTQQCLIDVTSAVKDGLNAGTNMLIDGGEIQVTAYDDGLKCPGTLTVAGGNTVVRAMGGDKSEGMEGYTVNVKGGSLRVLSADDAINAKQDISIEGGLVYAYSTSNDAVDANGSIAIKGGTLIALGGQVPEGGIDCDWNPIAVTGGTVFAVGGDNSRPSKETSTQPVIEYGMEDALEKGERLSLCDTEDNALFSFVSPRSYFKASIFYTSPFLKDGNTYSYYTGGVCQGGDSILSVVFKGKLTGGKSGEPFETESIITTIGMVMGGPGGPMGMPGNPMGGHGMPEGPMGRPDFPMGGPGGPMGMPGGPMGGPDGPMGMPGGPMGMPGGPMPFMQEEFPDDFPPSLPASQQSSTEKQQS